MRLTPIVARMCSGSGTGSSLTRPLYRPNDPPALPPFLADLDALTRPHGAFDSTARWHLTPAGLSVNSRPPAGTPGEPFTASQAVAFFGEEFRAAASEFGVPIELLIACACAEAGVHIRQGREAARNSERREPGFMTYDTTPHRVSVGVMHTLISTARATLRVPTLSHVDLRDPRTSIRAGASYIAGQQRQTGFDPPLVGAAYNAGGVHDDPTPGLPYSLRDFPRGLDRHVERFVAYFNDACGLVASNRIDVGRAPSFVRTLQARPVPMPSLSP